MFLDCIILALAIVDYRGLRVVARTVLPGILQGDKSDLLFYRCVDNDRKICWIEDFHEGVGDVFQIAGQLNARGLLETMIDDLYYNYLQLLVFLFYLVLPYTLINNIYCVKFCFRHYVFDLMRVTPVDANYTRANLKFFILRPELITAFSQKVSTNPK